MGCVPDVIDAGDAMWSRTITAATAPIVTSPSIDLRVYLPEVRDQLAENCCWHAATDAFYATARAEGAPIGLPSRAFPYALARLVTAPKQPLLDVGSSLRDGFRALADVSLLEGAAGSGLGWGLIPDALWPEDVSTTNQVPPDDCWRAGEYATLREYSALPDGPGGFDGCVAALRRVRFPTICCMVGPTYDAIGGGVYHGPGADRLDGSHCQLVVGYSPTLDALMVRNSWGEEFGFDGGYAWMGRDFVDSQTYGRWIVEVGPPQLLASGVRHHRRGRFAR